MALRHLYNTRLCIELGIANIYKNYSTLYHIVVIFLKIIFKAKKKGADGSPFLIFVIKIS
jgi:hypothetical protein